MQLSDIFQALVYRPVSPSLLQSMGDDLREILFPQSDPRHDSFSVSEAGHIAYTAFRNDLYCAPKSEQEALAAWEKYKQKTNERWQKAFPEVLEGKPPIFPDYLRMLPNVEAHYTQDLQGRQALDYWILTFQIELRVLRPKKGTTLLQAASVLQDYTSPFTQVSDTEGSLRSLETPSAEALRKQAEKLSHAVLEGEYLRVQIGEHGWVVGMEYHHTLLHPTPQPSDLYTLAPPKTGTQSVQKPAILANLVAVWRNKMAVPVDMLTRQAACREGVEVVESLNIKPFEDYYVSIDTEKAEMSFYITLFYNKLDDRIVTKIDKLKNIWTVKKAYYKKDETGKATEWTLHFNLMWKSLAFPVKMVSEYNGFEGIDYVRKKCGYGLLLSIRQDDKEDINEDKNGLTEDFVLSIGRGCWEDENDMTFSHELGHVFFNALDVLDEYIKKDIASLPTHINKALIESKIIVNGLQNQGSAKMKNPLDVKVEDHYMSMRNFMIPSVYTPKIETEGEFAGKVKPVSFRPNFGDDTQIWPDISNNGASTDSTDYGYSGPPLMSYTSAEKRNQRVRWNYEYRELIRATLLYLDTFMKIVYDTDYTKYPVKKYYLKRRSRIVFWDKPNV
jgi:hypothetical protein